MSKTSLSLIGSTIGLLLVQRFFPVMLLPLTIIFAAYIIGTAISDRKKG